MEHLGANTSAWVATTPEAGYPRLEQSHRVDVAVIGGGITGLTTALLLKQGGATVAVLERHTVAGGATGNTTAKITSLHTLVYAELLRSLGAERARQYGEANQAGLEQIARLVEGQSIDCDFSRMPAVTYTSDAARLAAIEAEVDVSRQLGLPASFVADADLPYQVAGGVRFDQQAQFHPRRYCLGLAHLINGDGGHVFENTGVTKVRRGAPCRVETRDGHTVAADRVVVATLLPFMNEGLFAARTEPARSYALGVRVDPAQGIGAMYISIETPTRSIRPHPFPGDDTYLVIGGEGHKTGHDENTEARYRSLETWARENFTVRSIEHRWSAQDFRTVDGVPYVGRLTPRNDRVYVATGFRKWGMTNGTAAAMILSGTMLDHPQPWAAVFDSTRANPRQSAKQFVKAQADVAARFVGDRLARRPSRTDEVVTGGGAIMSVGGKEVAVSRDLDGTLRAVSPVCTHLGCLVRWNVAERSWDCPCHGSRFDADGHVLEGPATRDLEPKSVPPQGGV
jgi:glycine/D-amino acid oxidase-like deaminating enzyme/nitrite reductase/ring-hydroxylating ferredoxin subunit